MKVRVIQQFGSHYPGEVHEARNSQDRDAFEKWVELGWAEKVAPSTEVRTRVKRTAGPPRNKARSKSEEK